MIAFIVFLVIVILVYEFYQYCTTDPYQWQYENWMEAQARKKNPVNF